MARTLTLPKSTGLIAKAIDRVVDAAFPQWGLRRAAARANRQLLEAKLAFDAARRDRVRDSVRSTSADADLLPDLQTLRDKSRTLIRDDAHAAAAIRVLVENVVGCGLYPQAAASPEETGMTQEQCDEWNEACEQVWHRYTSECDATGVSNWEELTRLIYRTVQVDGEALLHRVFVDGMTRWELIDADRLVDPSVSIAKLNVRLGVELGDLGNPVAYWITPYHPGDLSYVNTARAGNNNSQRVLREIEGWPNVLHLFRRERPGQNRGIPAIVPALPLFEHLHHYLDSELIAARANANVAMVVKRSVDKSDADLAAFVAGSGADGEPTYQYHQTIEPGTIEYLNPGEEMQSFAPARPGSSFDPFVTRVLRAICGALGQPYELVVKDFGGMNYSSARVALLEARRGFESERQLMIRQWGRPSYETRIREAIASGELPMPPQMAELGVEPFLCARWISGAWGWVDPVKEIDAARQACEANLSTPQAEAARAGMDVDEILEARARFFVAARKIEERNGLEPGTLTRERAERVEAVQPKGKAGSAAADDAPDDAGKKKQPGKETE